MRNFNDPFWRTSIGFDRLFDLMDESLRFEPEAHYPPCNIVRTGENAYRISLAVAGFKSDQLSITVNQNMLIVAGRSVRATPPESLAPFDPTARARFLRVFATSGRAAAGDRSTVCAIFFPKDLDTASLTAVRVIVNGAPFSVEGKNLSA